MSTCGGMPKTTKVVDFLFSLSFHEILSNFKWKKILESNFILDALNLYLNSSNW